VTGELFISLLTIKLFIPLPVVSFFPTADHQAHYLLLTGKLLSLEGQVSFFLTADD